VRCLTRLHQEHHLKLEDTVEITGRVRAETRSKSGYEVDILELDVLGRSGRNLPFTSSANLDLISPETLVEYRPLALRNEAVGNVFRVQAALPRFFREFLTQRHFTEIITSKLVASGTEGGTNLFEVKYFDRVAYLAQSPQFYKEHGVAGFERVFETGHVYRAEPHATSRHLTEYYSLDLELGFIDGPEDLIQLERELLTLIFKGLNKDFATILSSYRKQPLPSMRDVPCWEFAQCLKLLQENFNRADLTDDLDPQAERPVSAGRTRNRCPRRLRAWFSALRASLLQRTSRNVRRGQQLRPVVPGSGDHHRRSKTSSARRPRTRFAQTGN
jgi:nondiscriminating aspartyl-tRNA synthetase